MKVKSNAQIDTTSARERKRRRRRRRKKNLSLYAMEALCDCLKDSISTIDDGDFYYHRESLSSMYFYYLLDWAEVK
jgi:hypothetical protein